MKKLFVSMMAVALMLASANVMAQDSKKDDSKAKTECCKSKSDADKKECSKKDADKKECSKKDAEKKECTKKDEQKKGCCSKDKAANK